MSSTTYDQPSLFPEPEVFSVSELNTLVRELVEENYPDVAVTGEVSNFRRHSSGHLYFTLKDESAQLRVVCFRSAARSVAIDVEDGMQLIVSGRLTVYEGYGQYQLVAISMEIAGQGELEKAYRALLARLEEEGLFDPDHKLELPLYPRCIAVVTSPTGAAIRDILATIAQRWPCAEVLTVPVRVQGDRAPTEIVRALDSLAAGAEADVIILGRGGGSLEDLWSFNEEAVARAIYRCDIPIISGVGHETDVTICDWVADARAATPTAAAQMATPLWTEVLSKVERSITRLGSIVTGNIALVRRRLDEMLGSYALGQVRGRIEQSMQTIDYRVDSLGKAIEVVTTRRRSALATYLARFAALDPRAILSRGYAICTEPGSNLILRSVHAAVEAGEMSVTFADGTVQTKVRKTTDDH